MISDAARFESVERLRWSGGDHRDTRLGEEPGGCQQTRFLEIESWKEKIERRESEKKKPHLKAKGSAAPTAKEPVKKGRESESNKARRGTRRALICLGRFIRRKGEGSRRRGRRPKCAGECIGVRIALALSEPGVTLVFWPGPGEVWRSEPPGRRTEADRRCSDG